MHKKLIDIRKTFKTIANNEIDYKEILQAFHSHTDIIDDNISLLTNIQPHIDIADTISSILQGKKNVRTSKVDKTGVEFTYFRNVKCYSQKEFYELLKWRECIEYSELCNLVYTIFVHEDLLTYCNVTEKEFLNFMNLISYSYNRNTYHNIYHALDVTVRGYYLYKIIEGRYVTCKVILLSLLLGCLLHDVGHLGFRSCFLAKNSPYLEETFGSVSLNENMHLHIARIILKTEHLSIILKIKRNEQEEILSNIEKMILSTDLTMHNRYKRMLEDYKTINSNIIIKGPINKMSITDLIAIIKSADIANSTTEFCYYNKISNLIIAEENEERCINKESPWTLDSNNSYEFKLKFIEMYALDYFLAIKKRFFEYGFLYNMALMNAKLLLNKEDVGIDYSNTNETSNSSDS